MNVYRKRPIFHRRSESSVYRLFFWVVMILAGIWVIRSVNRGEIKPLFLPTPTPTRNAESHTLEGDALFIAGKLEDSIDPDGNIESAGAITAYRNATRVDPNNATVWAKLARIQTYSSAMLTTAEERKARMEEALESARKAEELSPDDSSVVAMLAFVLDWSSTPEYLCSNEEYVSKGTCKASQDMLAEAERKAVRALQLDNTNTLAQAFFAEILVDEQRMTQAEQNINQALERDATLMDVHRVHAYVLESQGNYREAINAYDRAIAITPNLTFLYLRAGANYRRLGFGSIDEERRNQNYDKSLEYFAKGAAINEQLGVKDPAPYISIAKTYSQKGDFFAAALNAQKALDFQPYNADFYGQLGVIYFKSRNYEGSIPALKCAVRGCTADESCLGRGLDQCDENNKGVEVKGLPLSSSTVLYYYTYGSVLAALSRPQENYCVEAREVLGEVKAAFGGDKDIASIVAAGEEICQIVDMKIQGITPEATLTLDPLMSETPTVTPTP